MTWREYDDALVADRPATLAAAYAPGDRVALQLPDGPGVHAAMLGVREGGHRRGRDRRARRRARGRRTSSSAPARATLLTGEPPRVGDARPRAADRRRRPLVPQLDLGHDRAAEDRDARPGALVRVPRLRATGSRDFTRRRRVPQRAAGAVRLRLVDRALHAGDRRRAVRRVRALRRRGRARRDRALPRHRARRGVDPVRDDAQLAGARRARPSSLRDHVHRRRDGAVRAGRGVRGPHRRARAPVLRHRTRPARCRARRPTTRTSSGCAPRAG